MGGDAMKRLTLQPGTDVVPALHGRAVAPVDRAPRVAPRLKFDQRATRASRFPLEQSLARIPEPPRLGRYLDIEV